MRRSPVVGGLALIVVGLALFFLRGSMETRVLMFLFMGGVFIAAAVYERTYGFLVPGGIMLGLGIGLLAEDWAWLPISESTPFGLGLGFLLIYALDRLLMREGSWWPLVPGGMLMLVGIGMQRDVVRWVFREGWPLAIVAVGVFLVLRGLFGSRSSPTEVAASTEVTESSDD